MLTIPYLVPVEGKNQSIKSLYCLSIVPLTYTPHVTLNFQCDRRHWATCVSETSVFNQAINSLMFVSNMAMG